LWEFLTTPEFIYKFRNTEEIIPFQYIYKQMGHMLNVILSLGFLKKGETRRNEPSQIARGAKTMTNEKLVEASVLLTDPEMHPWACELLEVCTSDFEEELRFEAKSLALKREDGMVLRSDVQKAFDTMKRRKPPSPWRFWMGFIGGSLVGIGLQVFVNGLNGSLNRASMIQMVFIISGLLLLIFRPQD